MPGETLGLIGKSGCGKTTTAKLILLQEKPTEGSIRFAGEEILTLQGAALMRYRRAVQVVFQDPYSSLSPRMRVRDIIGEPLEIHTDLSRAEIRERVAEVLQLVGCSRTSPTCSRTNSAAGSASALPSPGRWRPTRG